MKILLVDDDVFLRDMYAMKFKEHGDEVESAYDAAEALRMLTANAFEVMITDIVMPGMSGIELIKQIKSTENLKSVQCIVLSNQGEDSDIAEARKEGAVGYIIKAESIPSEVVTKVHSLIT